MPNVNFGPYTPCASCMLAIGSASVQSGALDGEIVRLVPTSNCHVAFGASPTAVADGTCVFLPAGMPIEFAITKNTKVAVIEGSMNPGSLFITVLA